MELGRTMTDLIGLVWCGGSRARLCRGQRKVQWSGTRRSPGNHRRDEPLQRPACDGCIQVCDRENASMVGVSTCVRGAK